MRNKTYTHFDSYEPKMENRFTVIFPEYFKIDSYVIHDVCRPSCNVNKGAIDWNDMTFRMYDPVCPSTSQAIMKGLGNLRTMDSPDITILIKELGPVVDKVAEWELIGEITYIDFGTLNWKSDEPVKITMGFKTNSCKLNY